MLEEQEEKWERLELFNDNILKIEKSIKSI
jgi:hypothetical protein